MKKEVSITIETESIPKDDSPRHISTNTKGTLFSGDGLLYILYKENPEEFGKTLTKVKIKDGRIELIRTGNIVSRLVFCKTLPFEGMYNTPYGSLPVKINVTDMQINADEKSGIVKMRYNLDFAGDITENKFTLKYN